MPILLKAFEQYFNAMLLSNMKVCKILVYVHASEDPLLFITCMLSSAQRNERRLKHHMFSITNYIKLYDNHRQSRGKCMGIRTGLLVKTNAQPAHVIKTCGNLINHVHVKQPTTNVFTFRKAR